MREAMLYNKLPDLEVKCNLCAHRCKIKDKKRGICMVRENLDGTLYTLVYGLAVSAGLDPIEKKPLYHFYPGSKSLSIATVGCNFRCEHCQNYNISQVVRDKDRISGDDFPPEDVVREARRLNCPSISYTYTEPTIFFEYALETGILARENGIKNVFVSNGYQTPETVETAVSFLDAINIDLKSFSDKFYRKICKARLQPVLESIKLMWEKEIWVEVTTLVIPNQNDSESELRDIARFLRGVSPDMVWHVSAFYPTYKMTGEPPTPLKTLERAHDIGKEEGLNYIYLGNVHSEKGSHTYCKNCGKLLIRRSGYRITEVNMDGSKCRRCETEQAGHF